MAGCASQWVLGKIRDRQLEAPVAADKRWGAHRNAGKDNVVHPQESRCPARYVLGLELGVFFVETARVDDCAGDAEASNRLTDELILFIAGAGKLKGKRLDGASWRVEDRLDAGSVRGVDSIGRNVGKGLNPASEVLSGQYIASKKCLGAYVGRELDFEMARGPLSRANPGEQSKTDL